MLTAILSILCFLLCVALIGVVYNSRANNAAATLESGTISSKLENELALAKTERDMVVRETIQLRTNQIQFLEHLSHELRTPLHALTNYSSFLKDDIDNLNQSSAQKQLLQIERHTRKIGRLIDQLENLAKLNRDLDFIKLVPVSFSLIVFAKLADFENIAGKRGIEMKSVETAEEIWVSGIENYLSLMIQHIIENSIEACKAGNRIIANFEIGTDRVKLFVTDNGTGVAPEELPKLFQPFYKTPGSISADRDGSGLGLYLCKRIAELHAGRIALYSKGIGKGSCIEVELPRLLKPSLRNIA